MVVGLGVERISAPSEEMESMVIVVSITVFEVLIWWLLSRWRGARGLTERNLKAT